MAVQTSIPSTDSKPEEIKKTAIGLLEEDDEFEEFPADWAEDTTELKTENVWEDNWDDENVEDDFSKQLRAELEKHTNASKP